MDTNNPIKTVKNSQQLVSLAWVAALLVTFGLGLGTGFLVWGKAATPAAAPAAAQANTAQQAAAVDDTTATQQVTRYDIPIDGEPALGPDDAPITLVAFSDFQCPYCISWYQTTWPLIKQNYGDKVRLVFRDFPLPNHTMAQSAAEAADCAFEQGKYWEYQDLLFNSTVALGDQTYQSFAKQLGLDETAFNACYSSGRFRDEVTADRDWGSNLGINSTPTFFINGIALVGAQPYATFQHVIEMELAGKFVN